MEADPRENGGDSVPHVRTHERTKSRAILCLSDRKTLSAIQRITRLFVRHEPDMSERCRLRSPEGLLPYPKVFQKTKHLGEGIVTDRVNLVGL